MSAPPHVGAAETEALAQRLWALASPVRLRILHRLAEPAFVPDLVAETGLTRQAVARHLDELQAVGLLVTRRATRDGAAPAHEYVASPAGLFALKEDLRSLALPARGARGVPALTRAAQPPRPGAPSPGTGLLLVHGDVRGRWLPLASSSCIVGRDPAAEVSLSYDPFVSGRHAHLRLEGDAWRITDLHSRNGTSVNFDPLAPGEERGVAHGDVLEVGRSLLVFRSA